MIKEPKLQILFFLLWQHERCVVKPDGEGFIRFISNNTEKSIV
jgi:hypothetical protein